MSSIVHVFDRVRNGLIASSSDANAVACCLRCVIGHSVLPRERFSRVLGMFSNLEVKVLYPT
jgi:hypothetical protein